MFLLMYFPLITKRWLYFTSHIRGVVSRPTRKAARDWRLLQRFALVHYAMTNDTLYINVNLD